MLKIQFSNRIGAITIITAFLLIYSSNVQGQNRGEQIYQHLCSTCHGSNLQGGTGGSFVDGEWKYGSERSAIVDNIKNGIPAQGMPPFGGNLTDQEINSIVDFIRSVESGEAQVSAVAEDTLRTLDYELKVSTFADNLEVPWAIDFLNERVAIITERPGRVRLVADGELQPAVSGTPRVLDEGQGGLLDVTVDPNYSENGWVYLAYSHALDWNDDDSPAMTRIVRGRIEENNWVDQQVVFEAPHDTYRTTRHHYGSQIVFDKKGYLYFSIGDRGGRPQAQDLSRPNGKIHRVYPDGDIPEDNPFVDREDALPSIFSYGHRNPQGLAVHPETDRVWDAEHGPRGGDELNLLTAGNNYGWPEITYGINYNGSILTRDRTMEGMEQPNLYWRPSIAVSGIEFYDGDMFPYWENRLLVGALAQQEVRLLNIKEDRVIHQEVILNDWGRVRDAVVGPDGAIYVVLNEPGKVIRISKVREALR